MLKNAVLFETNSIKLIVFKSVQGHKLSLSHAHVMPSSLAIVSQSLIIARIQEKLRVDETGKESRRDERGTEREGVLVMLKCILCDCRCIEVPRCLVWPLLSMSKLSTDLVPYTSPHLFSYSLNFLFYFNNFLTSVV